MQIPKFLTFCICFIIFFICTCAYSLFFFTPFEGLYFYTSLYLLLLSKYFLRIGALSYITTIQSSNLGHLILIQYFYLSYNWYIYNYPNNVFYNISPTTPTTLNSLPPGSSTGLCITFIYLFSLFKSGTSSVFSLVFRNQDLSTR